MEIPKLTTSPELTESFNKRATDLVKSFAIMPLQSESDTSQTGFDPGLFISASLGKADIIGEVRMCLVDETGHPVARYFGHQDRVVILEKDSYKQFEHLACTLMESASFRTLVSTETAEKYLFDWMEQSYRGAATIGAISYLIEKCQPLIRPYEVWVPVAQMCIQSEFTVGRVTLKSMSPQLFDNWEKAITHKRDKPKESPTLDDQRRKFQGRAAAVIRVFAELERAKEIAYRETALALSLLRVFSPASLMPMVNSYCLIMGSENLERATYFVVDDGAPLETNAIEDGSCRMWPLDNETIALCRGAGLDTLTSIVRNERRTEFQETLINAVLLFSRMSIQHDISDKVVYLLASMESLLSKSGGEPIQENLATRLALAVGKDVHSRREIVSTIKRVYAERSKYLHSGNRAQKVELVGRAMRYSWNGLIYAIERNGVYKRKDDFLAELDNIKLSGGIR